jgi:hypothetical protein
MFDQLSAEILASLIKGFPRTRTRTTTTTTTTTKQNVDAKGGKHKDSSTG